MARQRRYWLMKSEPDVFSFQDLKESPAQTTEWEGVRNYQARNLLRDEIKKDDLVLFYHSRLADPVIPGTAVVVREGYEDAEAFNKKSRYFDEKAFAKGVNPWFRVDIKAKTSFKNEVTRTQLKKNPKLKDLMVLAKGSRLSVQPVSKEHFEEIERMGKKS